MASSDCVTEEQVSFELPAPFGWKKKVLLSIFSFILFYLFFFVSVEVLYFEGNSIHWLFVVIYSGFIIWRQLLVNLLFFFPILLGISMVEIVIQQSDVVSARVCGFVLVFVLTYELLLFHINN